LIVVVGEMGAAERRRVGREVGGGWGEWVAEGVAVVVEVEWEE
jgi:hypothetical protein